MLFTNHLFDEVLWAVCNCQYLTSFDLAQGYQQMAMEDADINRVHSELDPLACTSSLVSHLDDLTQVYFLPPHGNLSGRFTICNTVVFCGQYLQNVGQNGDIVQVIDGLYLKDQP